MIEGSGSGSRPLTNGFGFSRPKGLHLRLILLCFGSGCYPETGRQTEKRRKISKFTVWSAGYSRGFSCSLEVFHGSPRINIMQFLKEKKIGFTKKPCSGPGFNENGSATLSCSFYGYRVCKVTLCLFTDPGFWCQKGKSIPPKATLRRIKHKITSFFSFLLVYFACLSRIYRPGELKSNPDPIRIRNTKYCTDSPWPPRCRRSRCPWRPPWRRPWTWPGTPSGSAGAPHR